MSLTLSAGYGFDEAAHTHTHIVSKRRGLRTANARWKFLLICQRAGRERGFLQTQMQIGANHKQVDGG